MSNIKCVWWVQLFQAFVVSQLRLRRTAGPVVAPSISNCIHPLQTGRGIAKYLAVNCNILPTWRKPLFWGVGTLVITRRRSYFPSFSWYLQSQTWELDILDRASMKKDEQAIWFNMRNLQRMQDSIGFQHLHPTFGFRSIHPLMQATSPWANSRWKEVGAPNAPPLNLAPWNSAVINGSATWENHLELSVSIYKSRIFPCLITGYIIYIYISEIAARQQLTSSRFSTLGPDCAIGWYRMRINCLVTYILFL